MVDLLEVEVEQKNLEEVGELQGLGEVGVVMGVGQVEESWSIERFLSRRLPNGRSYCS